MLDINNKKITMKLSWSSSMKWLKNVCRYDYNPYKKHILIYIAVCQLTKKKNPLHFINHNAVKSELFIGKMIQIQIFPLPLVGGNNFDVCILYFEIQFITNNIKAKCLPSFTIPKKTIKIICTKCNTDK